MNVIVRIVVLLAATATVAAQGTGRSNAGPDDWPAVTREARPWTRWWWMGSAVDPAHLTSELETFRNAGVGGVEITPIYGVRGGESRFIPYLSTEWVARLEHTVAQAQRLDLGVDMATGTGWPFGGPWVTSEYAPRTAVIRTYAVRAGERIVETVRAQQESFIRTVGRERPALVEPIEANPNLQALAVDQAKFAKLLPLQALIGYSDTGAVEDLTSRVGVDGTFAWVAPAGNWTLYALFQGWHGKMVERAAPGGEGNVIDHFSLPAIRRYLGRFDTAFAGRRVGGVRAFFNDSYEVDDAAGQADWTPALFDEFQRRRGYDLRRHLPALAGRDADDRNTRVLIDYRETVSDLLLETFTTAWHDWAHRRGAVVRNQAHGSPANILDLYAASDIPETEGSETLRLRWASSAAHVAGRQLASAEAGTWLNEHFRSRLRDVREAVDRFFLAGINHVVYHGANYSPPDEPWPGWLFYAAVHFNPRNTWWADFAALNAYVTRVQSFLQAARPDNDVLLYFPFHDALAVRGRGLLEHFGGPQPPLPGSPFDQAAETLLAQGYGFDFVSDRQLLRTRVGGGRLATDGSTYRALVVPASQYMPLATLEHMMSLVRGGATVVFFKGLPADVPGLHDLEARRARFRAAIHSVGRDRLIAGDDLDGLLTNAGVERETMVDQDLRFTRRRHRSGRYYFISNQGKQRFDGWVRLTAREPMAMLFDPASGARGAAATRRSGVGLEVRAQIGPGESVIVSTQARTRGGPVFEYFADSGPPQAIDGTWRLEFVSGGPALPAPVSIDRLASWTTGGPEDLEAFSGTGRYSIRFQKPKDPAIAWRLDLGDVRESARVRLNGHELDTLIGPAFTITLRDGMLAAENELVVEVTNLMANRIADLDRRGIQWKKFYNVNFPPRLAENRGDDGLFTAAKWAPLDSGLLGPVTLTPLR